MSGSDQEGKPEEPETRRPDPNQNARNDEQGKRERNQRKARSVWRVAAAETRSQQRRSQSQDTERRQQVAGLECIETRRERNDTL
jgi:hypothetical protein